MTLTLWALALQQGALTPGTLPYPEDETDLIAPAEHRARRETLLAAMPKGSAVVLFTNPERQRSNDTDFPFRANSDFLYLTGCNEPESAVILAPDGMTIDGKTVREALFVRPRNPASETWTGRRMGPEIAANRLGFAAALPIARFEDGLKAISGMARCRVEAITGAVGPLAKMIESTGPTPKDAWSAERQIGIQRTIKSKAELVLMTRAVDASMAAHREAIRSAEPGMREYGISSLVEYIFARNGCEAVAYGSIVGSGENSCTLHYVSNRKTMKPGEIVVMDVGGEYHGYAADVTRSFPVNGKFSPDQRAIYELVLRAQDAGIAACKVGADFGAADKAARDIINKGLVELGIIKDAKDGRRYFMHGTSHTVGLDVHDPLGSRTLVPDMVLTVEPGVYIAPGSPCDPKWWSIGVRIEDDIHVTPAGPVNMSGALPRSVTAIEALMAEKGLGNRNEGTLAATRG